MTVEEELTALKERYEQREKFHLKRRRQTALVFGLTVMLTILLMVYSYFQQSIATKEKMRALEIKLELVQCRKQADESLKSSTAARAETERSLQEALEISRKSKK